MFRISFKLVLDFVYISGCDDGHHDYEDPDASEDDERGYLKFLDLFAEDEVENENSEHQDEEFFGNPINIAVSRMLEDIVSRGAKNV